MPAEKGFGIAAALVLETPTYATDTLAAADDGYLLATMAGGVDIGKVPDPSLNGTPFMNPDDNGNNLFAPSQTLFPRYRGGFDLMLALFAGADVVTPIEDMAMAPIGGSHQMILQNDNEGLSGTFVTDWPEAGKTKVYTGWKPTSIALTIATGEAIEAAVESPAKFLDTASVVNDPAAFASVTIPTPVDRMMFQDAVIRLADFSDTVPLASPDDNACVDSATVTYERPYQIVVDSCNAPLIAEPLTDGNILVTVELNYPRTVSLDLLEEFIANQYKMGDITVTGPVITGSDTVPLEFHELRLFFPLLQIQEYTDDVGGPEIIPTTLSLEGRTAQADAAGMTASRNPYYELDNELQTNLLV